MKEFRYPIGREILSKGLAPAHNPKNNPMLIQATGCYIHNGALKALEQFGVIDTSILGTMTFPYPQLFVFSRSIVVCTSTSIWELVSGSLVLGIDGLTAGAPWTAIDGHIYIYLTNGVQAVKKDPKTTLYSVDSSVPFGSCVCNYNGQVFIGAPQIAYGGA